LQGGAIKQLTGNDSINARGLYSDNTETKLDGTYFVLCNVIPNITSVEEAIANRIVVISFPTKFVNEDAMNELHEQHSNETESQKDTWCRTNNTWVGDINCDSTEFRHRYKMALCHILLKAHHDYKIGSLTVMNNIPKSVKDRSNKYLMDSDSFYHFTRGSMKFLNQ
jgi:hypothetical protein